MKLSSAVAALFLAGTTWFDLEVHGSTPQHEGVINQGQESGLGKSFHRTAAVEMKHGQGGGLVKDDVVMNNVLGGHKEKDEDEMTDGRGGIVVGGQGEVKAKYGEGGGSITKATKGNIQSFDDSEIAKILSELKIHRISSNPHLAEKHQNENRTLQNAVEFVQIGRIIDDEAAGDKSGYSVSMSDDGKRVAIGSIYKEVNGISNVGQLRIFELDVSNSSWAQLGNGINGDERHDRFGWSVSMSSDGTRVAVSSKYHGNYGQVKIFEYNVSDSDWAQLGSDIDGVTHSDNCGSSVSMSGNGRRVAVGASKSYSASGHVTIFEYGVSDSDWAQLGNGIVGEEYGDQFGHSVSMSYDGTSVAMGARHHDGENGSLELSGNVRIFGYDDASASWEQLGNNIDGEFAKDLSGSSVSVSGDGKRVAIGSPHNIPNDQKFGHVRIFEYVVSESAWTQLGSDIDGEELYENFGFSVSMSYDGTRVAVGAYTHSGCVRIFDYDDSSASWVLLGNDIDGEHTQDFFGWSVSMTSDGTRVAVGAPQYDGNNGAVRIFDLAAPTAQATPGQTPSPTLSPTPSPTLSPTSSPTVSPTPSPTVSPTPSPTALPTPSPTALPTPSPTALPTPSPTASPTSSPTVSPFSWEIDPSGNWTATFDDKSAGNELEGKYKMTVSRHYKFEVLEPDCQTEIGSNDTIKYVEPGSKIVPETGVVDAKIDIAMDKLSAIDNPEVFFEDADANTDKIKICIKGSLVVSDTDPTSVNFHETILTILINKARTFVVNVETERTAAINKTENVTVDYNVTSFICAGGDLKNDSTWVEATSGSYSQGDPLKVCLKAPNTDGVSLDKVTTFELEQVTGGSKGKSLMIGKPDIVMAGGILADSKCSKNACMIKSMIPAKYFDDTVDGAGTPYNLKAGGDIILKFGARRLKGVLVDSSSIGRSGATSRGLQSEESAVSSSFEVSVGLKGENMVEEDGREVSAANPSFAGRLPVLLSFVGAVLFTGVALVN